MKWTPIRASFPLPAATFLAAAVLTAAVLAAPDPAGAQAGPTRRAEPMREDSFGDLYDRRLPDLGARHLEESLTNPGCPGHRFDFEVNYPAATGNPELDRMFEAAAAADLEEVREELDAAGRGDCGTRRPGSFTRRFEAHSPSPGVLSLVFTLEYAPLGASAGVRGSEALVVDLGRAARMELKDVFADHGRAAPALWAMVARGWCASPDNRAGVLPSYYGLPEGSDSCRGGPPPLPPQIARDPSVFAGFGHVFLTAEGLTVRLNGAVAWGPDEAVENLELGKAELIGIGARPEIWR